MAKKMYTCEFPGCGQHSFNLSAFDFHHIVPRSMKGADAAWNRMTCCPGCHRRIHVPGMTHGIHTLKFPESIIVHGYLSTSSGKALRYTRMADDKTCIWYYRDSELSVQE